MTCWSMSWTTPWKEVRDCWTSAENIWSVPALASRAAWAAFAAILDTHAKRAFEAPSRIDDVLGDLTLDNPVLRRVPHLELTARHDGGGDKLKIGHWNERPDFQLALAHDCQSRGLHPTNPDHAPGPSAQNAKEQTCSVKIFGAFID